MKQPKIRLSSMADKEDWKTVTIGDVVTENLHPVPMPNNGYDRVGVYCHAKGTFREHVPPEKALSVDKMYRIEKDNLIVNISFAWEHAIAVTKEEDDGLLVSHRFPTYKFNDNQLPAFYKYLILDKRIEYELMVASPGGAGRNRVLNRKAFLKIPITIPCLEEQQKIADCLSSVDAVIADYEAQVENMQNQKKGVMQKLFSQEVRFKVDDGSEFPEWDETTIGECCDILDSKRKPITKQYREKGPYPYYGATNIQDHVSGYLFDEPLVLVAEDGGPFNDYFNKPIAQWAEGKFWVNNHAHVLRPHGNRKFMFYVLVHKDIRNYINNPGRGKLNQEDMRRIIVPQPCLEEQQKIADCLTAFDDAIEDLQKIVEHWKNIKKGLLQQLFV